ncbi:MAG: D-alanine--D-alanine ligase [Pyrinomonadaceae bacterium]|nr:D-alanine--D-alanine ligase [Pyrinomonadaceae bacterium]MCX7639913.1 D-alanine--D-alanine ligase [Pyrinomonadaceae bacterium]MDW8304085.1 D-alanine--D-alanine ligase family protein [Acidobacteriota bacterium]
MRTRVGLIFGGRSGEHEISIRSAKSVIEQIDKEKYEVIPIAITKEGRWLNPIDSISFFPEETQKLVDLKSFNHAPITLSPDTSHKGLINLLENIVSPIDVFFPVLHGTYGEDGTIQGIFEMAGVPYVGCGVLASSCGMDKVIMKNLFKAAGLPTCRFVWFLRSNFESDKKKTLSLIKEKIGFPCFVKPANLGSSVGVSKAEDEQSLEKAVELAAKYDRKIIVEEALKMREIECAIIGNEDPQASLPGEYVIRNKEKSFLDYTEKYASTGNNEFVVPAPISNELVQIVQKMAIKAFKAIDGSGLARVDFFLKQDDGRILVNEINTMPGLTDASGFPKMWQASGLSFQQIIERLINLAFERHQDKSRNKTVYEN